MKLLALFLYDIDRYTIKSIFQSEMEKEKTKTFLDCEEK